MRLYEIDYALAIPDHDLSQAEIDQAPQVGTVDRQPVYVIDTGVYVIAFMKKINQVSAYVVISSHPQEGYHDLIRMANVQHTRGSMTALMVFLHKKFDVKYRIPALEPLTLQGLRWVQSIIRNGRGFKVTDGDGAPLNSDELEKEWMNAKNTRKAGATQILIPEISARADVFECVRGPWAACIQYVHDDSCVL
jgi:hypothetical protein